MRNILRTIASALRSALNPPRMRAAFPSRKELDAKAVLEKHGLTARRYMPTVGNAHYKELLAALSEMHVLGFLVFYSDGNLVGVLGPTDEERVNERRKHGVRLVVNNS